MEYKQEHEPELQDMDDYDKPLDKSKLRVILIGFVILIVVWGVFRGVAALIGES